MKIQESNNFYKSVILTMFKLSIMKRMTWNGDKLPDNMYGPVVVLVVVAAAAIVLLPHDRLSPSQVPNCDKEAEEFSIGRTIFLSSSSLRPL